jgi:glycogen(starch) synthase
MHLLFLSNLYPPHDMGGYEQWCREVATRLQERGHTVWVLTSRHGLNNSLTFEQNVIRTLYLQADVHYYKPMDFFLRRMGQERANKRELKRAMNQTAPDLVVIWGMWDLSRNLPYWAEQWMPGQVAYYVSSYWPNDMDIHEEYWQLPARRRLTELIKKPFRTVALAQLRREGYPPKLRFEHAVCCSEYVRDTLVQASRLPAHAGVLYGGIDPKPFLQYAAATDIILDNFLRLLFVGTLLPHKGVHTAFEALALLKRKGLADHVTLTILGSGHPDYEAHLRTMATRLHIDDKIHFAGRVPRHEISSWLGRFDVFLFTSIWAEPMARSVMEAMAAGLLVIGTKVGGQMEMLVDEENGLTFQAGDAEALANHIERVLSEPALLSRLARAGQQMVLQRFTLKRMVDDIEVWLEGIAI